ncbi:hypothetical protein V5T82_10220 [Magnetovibrio sp. PR-2]|uniref:hypothetical protein n=1 Tax=Magnetovibrio sp. PR-2 TaxID=3120356 RepID=UPI002FCE4541
MCFAGTIELNHEVLDDGSHVIKAVNLDDIADNLEGSKVFVIGSDLEELFPDSRALLQDTLSYVFGGEFEVEHLVPGTDYIDAIKHSSNDEVTAYIIEHIIQNGLKSWNCCFLQRQKAVAAE